MMHLIPDFFGLCSLTNKLPFGFLKAQALTASLQAQGLENFLELDT